MRELYSHKVTNSFYLWFDHTLLNKATAYQNITTPLYYTKDNKLDSSQVPYASPFKQWVADSSVDGATIPSGVNTTAGVIERPDVKFDFDNGRVLFPVATGTGATVSGSYAIKDFNTYVVDTEEDKIVFEGNYLINSRYKMIAETGVSPRGYAAPACFIMNTASDNKPFAFGGEQDTKNKMRVIVAAEDIYSLDGVVSVFRDMVEVIIPLLTLDQSPFNEWGDLKSGSYNYQEIATNAPERYMFLEKVTAIKINSTAAMKINPNLKFGIIDFYLSEPRFPKQDL